MHLAGQVRGQHLGGQRQVIPLGVRDALAEPATGCGNPPALPVRRLSYRIAYTSVRAANSAPKNATFSSGVEPPCTGPGGASKNPAWPGRGSAACFGVSSSRRSSRAFSARRRATSAATAISRQHEAMGRPVTTATLVRVKATLRAALNAAIRAGHITTNAAARAELPAARRPRAVVWTAERVREWQRTGLRPPVAVWTPVQTARFLNSIRGHRLYAAYHLIALRGLRRGEAAGLRWCDIDLDADTAVISWQLQQYDGHLVLCPPKTARGERVIALDRTTVAALRAHRAAQQAERASAGDGYHDSGYVFTRANGEPMAPDWLSRYFRQLCDAAGLPPIRLHDLRHGAASLALAVGADLKVVQDMLGHSSIVLSADTYISVLPEIARETAEAIATLIIEAGCLVPGTQRRRRPGRWSLRQRAHALLTGDLSRAHPARQLSGPRRPAPPRSSPRRLAGAVPGYAAAL